MTALKTQWLAHQQHLDSPRDALEAVDGGGAADAGGAVAVLAFAGGGAVGGAV